MNEEACFVVGIYLVCRRVTEHLAFDFVSGCKLYCPVHEGYSLVVTLVAVRISKNEHLATGESKGIFTAAFCPFCHFCTIFGCLSVLP